MKRTAEELYGEEKLCRTCCESLPLSEFNGRGKQGPWLQPSCKKCQAEKAKSRFNKMTDEQKSEMYKRAYATRKKVIEQCYEYINKVKSKPCADCKRCYPPYAMDLDHVEDNKVDCVAKMVYHGASFEDVVKEVDKCEPVCATCHRIRTFERQGRFQ